MTASLPKSGALPPSIANHQVIPGMRILELINSLDTGGAERMVSNLALNMQASGHFVHVICLRDFGAMPVPEAEFQRLGVALLELNKPDGFHFPTLGKLVHYARTHHIDVIHSHNPLVNHYAVLTARLARVPVVVHTLHGVSTLSMPPWAKLLYRASCCDTDRIVSVSSAVQEAFHRQLRVGLRRLAVIPNGIELRDLLAIPPKARGKAFVFGSIGRLTEVKDQDSMLRAFAEVRRQFPESRLEILGSGELEADLRELSRSLGIEDAVCFHGWDPDIAKFLARWDLFLLTSRSEGLPLTLLEAMAAGLPVIATTVGGIPEVVNRAGCGWLCPPRQPAELAQTMLRALTAPDLARKAEAGRADAVAHHSAAHMSQQYLELFGSLVQRHTRK